MKLRSAALCIVLSLSALVNAHVIFEPPWVSYDGATFQEWSFDDEDNPAVPEFMSNSYGRASAAITVGAFGEGWLGSLPGLGTQTGLWDLGSAGEIVIDIDNRPEPLLYKEIWVQVTYFMDISKPPIVEVAGANLSDVQTTVVEDVGLGQWLLDFSRWRIEPNPPHEQIVLTSDPEWGAVIDQIVVHTICIPEPLSICLLALGSLLVRRRRYNQ